jgi:hypothetical protein
MMQFRFSFFLNPGTYTPRPNTIDAGSLSEAFDLARTMPPPGEFGVPELIILTFQNDKGGFEGAREPYETAK